MDKDKEILFLRQSESKKWVYIRSSRHKVLEADVEVLLISRKYLVEVMKGKREWCIVDVVKEKEE